MSSAQPPKDPGKDADAAKAEAAKNKWSVYNAIAGAAAGIVTAFFTVFGISKITESRDSLNQKIGAIEERIRAATEDLKKKEETLAEKQKEIGRLSETIEAFKNSKQQISLEEVNAFLASIKGAKDFAEQITRTDRKIRDLETKQSPFKYNISGYWHALERDADNTERIFILHKGVHVIKMHHTENGMVPNMRGINSATINERRHFFGYVRSAEQISDTDFVEYAGDDVPKSQATRLTYDPKTNRLTDSRATYRRVEVKLLDEAK